MREKSAAKEDKPSGIVIRAVWRLAKVRPISNYRLEVEFIDGTSGLVDMKNFIASDEAGVFSILKNINLFNQVYLNYGVATWPGEIDLAPDAMYTQVKKTGIWIVA